MFGVLAMYTYRNIGIDTHGDQQPEGWDEWEEEFDEQCKKEDEEINEHT